MYTDLIKIEHPPEAVAGTSVAIDIYVKNQHSAGLYLKVTASVNDNVIVVVSPSQVTAEPGVTYIIRGVFTMPSVNAVIRAYSWYLGTDLVTWFQEDYQTRTVKVTGGADPLFETLEVDITEPDQGYVTSEPASQEGRTTWTHNSTGQFVYGTNVLVTAHPNSGYVFDHWSDEITGGTTINNPAYVQPMTEYRTVKAHFREETPDISTGLRSTTVNTVRDTYDHLALVPYSLNYEYKGSARGGTILVEMGTGVYPIFSTQAVVGPFNYQFAEKTDYTPVLENRTFPVPSSLTPGQTYSVRVTLTTDDGVTDNDIDYNAFVVLDNTIPSTDLQALVVDTSYRDYALGEVLSFSLTFKYKGIAQAGKLRTAIKKGLAVVHTFDEADVQYQESILLNQVTWNIELTLPHTLEGGQVYSLYARLTTADGKDTSDTKGTAFRIDPGEIPEDPEVGEYRLIKDYTYPYGEDYVGAASEATVEITVPFAQMPGGDWLASQITDRFEDNVALEGSHMLRLVVYERDNGLTSKDYKIVATATKLPDVAGQEIINGVVTNLAYVSPQLAFAAWVIIILAVLLALSFIITVIAPTVREVVWGEGGVVDTIFGIAEMIPMLLIVMVMGMMMEMMSGFNLPAGTPAPPKPITEAVKGAASAAVSMARGGVQFATEAVKGAGEFAAAAKHAWETATAPAKAARKVEHDEAQARELESRRKLDEAKEDLRKRRAEQDAQKGQTFPGI